MPSRSTASREPRPRSALPQVVPSGGHPVVRVSSGVHGFAILRSPGRSGRWHAPCSSAGHEVGSPLHTGACREPPPDSNGCAPEGRAGLRAAAERHLPDERRRRLHTHDRARLGPRLPRPPAGRARGPARLLRDPSPQLGSRLRGARPPPPVGAVPHVRATVDPVGAVPAPRPSGSVKSASSSRFTTLAMALRGSASTRAMRSGTL